MPYSSCRTGWWLAIAIAAAFSSACSRSSAGPDGAKAIRLVDGFDAKQVEGSAVTRAATTDIKLEPALAGRVPWPITAPAVAGEQMQTYTITPAAPVSGPRIRYLLIRPTDAPGADFAIESVRLVFRREQLAG